MMYWKMASGSQLVQNTHALNFDGIGNYIISNASHVQEDKSQAFTLEFFMQNVVASSANDVLYDTRTLGGSVGTGIVLRYVNSTTLSVQFCNSTRRMIINFTVLSTQSHLALTFTGNAGVPNITDVNLYQDGVLCAKGLAGNNLLAGSDIDNTGELSIGRQAVTGLSSGNYTGFWQGEILEVSRVDYAKNLTEINADIANGSQLAGSGAFLFKCITQYNKNIKSLDSTLPFKELTQNLDMQFVGYPNPLVLNTNLILI